MVGIDELLGWQPARLSTVVDGLLGRRRALTGLQDEIDDSRPPASWLSDAGDNAREAHEQLRQRLLDMAAEVGKVAASVDFAEEEVEAARRDLQLALDQARAEGFDVDRGRGVVSDPATYDDPGDAARAQGRVAAIADEIGAALDKAARADADLARALVAAIQGRVDGGTGSLAGAANQLPSALDAMSPAEIAQRYADDVALETVQAWLEAELELATWELEGAARATYVVEADGEVKMRLLLEGGLGREVEVAGAEVDVSGGLSTELELSFDSVADAERFLDGLDDAAFDLSWTEYGRAPVAVAENVAEYVGEQDITGFRTGIYGKAGAEFDTAWARGEAEGRVDGYYDWVKEEYGLKFTASVESELGRQQSGFSGSGELTGEAKLDSDGEFKEVTFTGRISASVANERLGLDLPDTSTGAGADVEVKMERTNPYFPQFQEATMDGDLDRAAELALDHGRVVVRTHVVEEYASGEHEFDIKVAEAEVAYGANAEIATRIWVRPPGEDYVLPMDPRDLR